MDSEAVKQMLKENLRHERGIHQSLSAIFAMVNTDMDKKIQSYLKLRLGADVKDDAVCKLLVSVNTNNLILMNACLDLMCTVHSEIERKHDHLVSLEEEQ